MADQKILDQIIQAVREVIEPDKIILFGSQARGDDKIDSDYDILIIKDTIEDERMTIKKLYRQMVGVNAAIDIILKTNEGIEKSKQRFISVTKEALDEGIIIYE